MKLTITLLALMLSFNVAAFGNNQGSNQNQNQGQHQGQAQGQAQGQLQGQALFNKNILAAEATNETVVDLTSVNKNANLNANKNQNLNANLSKNDNSNKLSNRLSNDSESNSRAYSEGSKSKSISGANSGSNSKAGDNTNNITIEGDAADLVAANTAVAALASECVDSTAAQGIVAGFSTSGVNASCLARSISSWHLARAQVLLAMPDCEPCNGFAVYSITKSQEAAKLADTNWLASTTSKTRSVVTDMAWIIGAARLVAMGF